MTAVRARWRRGRRARQQLRNDARMLRDDIAAWLARNDDDLADGMWCWAAAMAIFAALAALTMGVIYG